MKCVLRAAAALLAAVLGSATGPAWAQKAYFVRPGAAGMKGLTPADALGTIEQARDALRARSDASITSDITVFLLPGTYTLRETLAFDDRDSGRNGFRVTYAAHDPQRPPVLSGGRRITTKWEPGAGGVWSADAGEGVFRQFYVNDVPAVTARDPNPGPDNTGWKRLKQWEDRYGSKSVRLHGPDNLKKTWERQGQIEFVVKYHWAMARLHLGNWGTFDNDNVLFPPEQNIWTAIAPRENDQFYFLENAREFLDQPGEWYLDRTAHRVYYKPRPGENLATAPAVAPVLERLVTVTGKADRPVRNLSLRGLRFAHSGWVYRNNRSADEGFVGAQAHLDWNDWKTAPAAVEFEYSEGVRVEDCRFRNLGGTGLKLARGTSKTLVQGNVFSHTGDTGILVYTGRVDAKDAPIPEAEQSRDDVIRNNYVEKAGRENFGAAGIGVVMARRITVEHNEVAHCPYAGITFGYFTAPSSPSVGNRVQFNYVHHVMQEMDDGGAIYVFHTKFDAPHNASSLLVYRNFVHDVRRGPQSDHYPNAAIYLDEGTRGNVLRENVLRNVGNWLHLNTGGGPQRETLPERQTIAGNTDGQPSWEAEAGLQKQYARLRPSSAAAKPKPAFAAARLLRHLPTVDAAAQSPVSLTSAPPPASASGGLPPRFTVVFWVNVPESARGDLPLVSSPSFKVWAVAADGGKPIARVHTEFTDRRGPGGADVFADASFPGGFPVGQWVHVALTVDRRHAAHRLYLNGKDVTKTDYFGRPDFDPNGPLLVGAGADGVRRFPGPVRDFRLYGDVLRPVEVHGLAAKRPGP